MIIHSLLHRHLFFPSLFLVSVGPDTLFGFCAFQFCSEAKGMEWLCCNLLVFLTAVPSKRSSKFSGFIFTITVCCEKPSFPSDVQITEEQSEITAWFQQRYAASHMNVWKKECSYLHIFGFFIWWNRNSKARFAVCAVLFQSQSKMVLGTESSKNSVRKW